MDRTPSQQHFWLNEGFTVYVERLIIGQLEGEPARHFHAFLGSRSLQNSVAQLGPSSPLTALVPDLNGVGTSTISHRQRPHRSAALCAGLRWCADAALSRAV